MLGAWANSNFQNSVQTTRVDPAVLSGWGVRPYNWQYSVGVQQQIAPRMSVDVSWSRRQWGNFFVTDNAANSASDFTIATIPAPANPTLADNGYTTVSFPVISAAKFGLTDNYYTKDSNYGNSSYYWSGFDVTFNARTRNGITFQGGTSSGAGHRDFCEVTAKLPELLIVLGTYQQIGSCKVDERWLTSARGLVSYTLPKVGRAHQRVGPLDGERAAVDNVHVRRDPMERRCRPTTTCRARPCRRRSDVRYQVVRRCRAVDLTLPGQIYGDRINALDMRFAKVLRFNGTRTNIGIDLYNLFNANTGTAFNQAFGTDGSTWLRPTTVLNPRFLRFNVTFDF